MEIRRWRADQGAVVDAAPQPVDPATSHLPVTAPDVAPEPASPDQVVSPPIDAAPPHSNAPSHVGKQSVAAKPAQVIDAPAHDVNRSPQTSAGDSPRPSPPIPYGFIASLMFNVMLATVAAVLGAQRFIFDPGAPGATPPRSVLSFCAVLITSGCACAVSALLSPTFAF
eukprot:6172678-Pleurochrysis_carterae.AAC.1